MRGRTTAGPRLVRQLDGSEQAKQRLEVILRNLTGELTVKAACQELGIHQARFHDIRRRALEAAVADLEPRRPGRPAAVTDARESDLAELNARVVELEEELRIAEVRAEIAQVLPGVVSSQHAGKKTRPRSPSRSKSPRRNMTSRGPCPDR